MEGKIIDYYENDFDWNKLPDLYSEILLQEFKKKSKSSPTGLDKVSSWETFYKFHQDKFFKDRKYLTLAFQLIEKILTFESDVSLMECGCGAGNTLYPLIQKFPTLKIFAFDCSKSAVMLVKSHSEFQNKNIEAECIDIVNEELPKDEIQFNVITMIFFLSAIDPAYYPKVFQKINQKLKVGGVIIFRDYGFYDLSQIRNHKKGNFVQKGYYQKSDGISVFYFTIEDLKKLADATNLELIECRYSCVAVKNIKRDLTMHRVFLSATLKKITK